MSEFELSKESVDPSPQPTEKAKDELKVFANPDQKENSIIVKLWGGGHLSFNPNSHTPIFSIVALFAVLITCLIVVLIGIVTPHDAVWMDKITTALGYAITGIIGAMVGSSASKDKDKDK